MLTTLVQLVEVFGRLSLLAVGGGISILPEMQRLTVGHYHWLSDSQFRDSYSLGQITPGPGMLMATAIGYRAAGFPGAVTATLAMFLPTCVLTVLVGRHWDRFSHSPWRVSLQRGLAPVTIGLMLAGVVTLGQTAVTGPVTALVALLATAILLRSRISPSLLVLAGGVVGWFLLR
ncbi:MAG: chromate transporter [Dehalococcoidia bacterium]